MDEEAFRLKVTLHKGEVHIHGNRAGLTELANTCAALSVPSDKDPRTAANHVIYAVPAVCEAGGVMAWEPGRGEGARGCGGR